MENMIICIVVLVVYFCLSFRAIKTFNFKDEINNACFGYLLKNSKEYSETQESVWELYDRYSSTKLFLSFKKLTFESWYNEKETKILKEGIDYFKNNIILN